jgi:tetratricopeptide (TPR) repeat protein
MNRCHCATWLVSAVLLAGGPAMAQVSPALCGPIVIPGMYGPWDYRTDRAKLPIIEGAHFTPAVESLLKGSSGKTASADLDYTISHVPNHHRALVSIMRLGEGLGQRGDRMPLTTECYFERAIRWRHDDVIVRMLYAQFLHKARRADDAQRQLEVATRLAGENELTHQNIGLVYLEIGDLDKALAQAWRVRSINPQMQLLQSKLEKAGRWREPAPAAAEPAASGASSAG